MITFCQCAAWPQPSVENGGTPIPEPISRSLLTELRTRFLFPLNAKSSAYLTASGGTTLGYEDTGIPPFSLGGGLQLSAFGENELITNQYYLFQTGYIRRLAKLPPFLGDSISLVTTYEAGKTFFVPERAQRAHGWSGRHRNQDRGRPV